MTRFQKFSLAFSVLLHAILLATLWLAPSVPLSPEPPAIVEWIEAFPGQATGELEGTEKTDAKKASNASRPRSDGPRASVRPMDFSLKSQQALKNQWSNRIGDIAVGEGTDPSRSGSDPAASLEGEGQGWSQAVQFGNSMDLAFTAETYHFFSALHKKVDGLLVYPDDFARQRLNGKIRVEAELGRDGRLVHLSATYADNDVLLAYTIAYLIHVLREPLPERYWLKTERAIVAFDFDFRTRIVGMAPSQFVVGVQKNHLLFGREALVDSKVNEKIHEVFTHYVPPIVPLPGGFYVDFVLAYKFIKNLKDGAPTESEARRSRIQALHTELLQTIHRRAEPTPAPSQTPKGS